MDNRPPAAAKRPTPPHRALSGSFALQHGLKRTPIPSRLHNVRSFSQPVNAAHLPPSAAPSVERRNSAAFQHNHDSLSSSPAPVESSADDDHDRPAKRARTNAHRPRQAQEFASEVEMESAYQSVPGYPLPQIPRQMAPPSRCATQKRSRAVVHRTARRADGLEPPTVATQLPSPRGVADFSPWSGNHPEDIMNETVVKAGYCDKPPGPNSTESNSAKPTIWPNLSQKNNMGLQTLSYLFTQVMEKRQAMGRCSAPSTFKPPPRVTVTDTKREAWLRDLSNPDVPLRKQSRTIPHGIRGKGLMDHCLLKDIPLPRAVWLAKCVGANELRAFRRKGVSGPSAATGEAKWARDWTMQVESFLESVIGDCGKPEWQSKMDYAVKLATSFYSEQLLERDHYLDWIVSSLAHAAIDTLPVWIILTQFYWRDITSFGRRGRKLAEAVLENLHQITTGSLRANGALKERLKKLVVVLAVTNRGCLIMPRTWERYRYLLAPKTLSVAAGPTETAAQNIMKRNSRLTGPLLKTPQNTRSPLLELYTLLDAVELRINMDGLTTACLAKVPDTRRLVSAILDWSASVYRTRQSRVYLSAKLIANLHHRGNDTDEAVLHYLKTDNTNGLNADNIHRVVAELVRARCFSTARYLQWLMTTGALSGGHASPLATGLLASLPLDSLPPHLLNTRNMLLDRLGHFHDESLLVGRLEAEMDPAIRLDEPPEHLASTIETFSGSSKLDLARRLSVRAAAWVKETDGGITLRTFCALRSCLQQCGDLPVLAQVVQACIGTEDTVLLGTICDTMNSYATVFAASGSLQTMLDQLHDHYRTLSSQHVMDRCLVLSLIALVHRFPERVAFRRLLETDLAKCEMQTSMAVYSPASDSLVNMQASHLDSDNDIDAVFLSGNTMDEQLMHRVFSRIVQRAAKPGKPASQAPSNVCRWFNQLRALDSSCFEQLVKGYVQACLKSSGESMASLKVVSSLVASGCAQLDNVVDLATDANTSAAALTAIRLLSARSVANDTFHPIETFRFEVQQKSYQSAYACKVIPMLTHAMDDPKFSADDGELLNLVLEYSTVHCQEGRDIFTPIHQSTCFSTNSSRVTANLMNLSRGDDDRGAKLNPSSIVALANPLSIMACASALGLHSTAEALGNTADENGLQHSILEAINNGCEVWPQLLGRAGRETIKSIYQWARERVISDILQGKGSTNQKEDIERHLEILDVAHHAAKDDDSASVMATVTDKLKLLEARLHTLETDGTSDHDRSSTTTSLQTLLHLSNLFSSPSSPDADSLKQSRTNLLAALCTLLVHPKLQAQEPLLEYIHDVASTVADHLPLETLSALARCATTGITRDPRLASILGTAPSPDSWLALVSHPQPPGSQQQRVLLKQSSSSSSAAASVSQRPGQPAGLAVVNKPVTAPPRPEGRSVVPFPLRRWEIIPDATPAVGENDTSLSLGLFGARRVV